MALSEHEKTILEQFAQEFERDDPKLASKMGRMPGQAKARHLATGIFAAIVGCLVMFTGIAARTPALGVIGFTLMGAGLYLATMRVASFQIRRRPTSSTSMGPAELG